jgi:ArsR family transcriptional regulator
MANMKTGAPEKKISRLLRALGQPARLQILLAIGEGEACVCHLEAALGLRQAYISQHLMALRKAKVLETRRDGRFIFYRLRDPSMLELIQLAGWITGGGEPVRPLVLTDPLTQDCVCPTCAPPGEG